MTILVITDHHQGKLKNLLLKHYRQQDDFVMIIMEN